MTRPKAQTLGILGGGQLGRFLAEAARGLGWRSAVLDADPRAPALQVADVPVVGRVDDPEAARRLAGESGVVTLEWELIPAAVLEEVARIAPLYPAPSVLAAVQDRLVQKRFLEKNGFPQTPYGEASSAEGLPYPVVIKRRRHGYDGKGQCVVETAADAPKAAGVLEAPCVWERKVPFSKEISVVLARGRGGELAAYPLCENIHRGGILHATLAPARVPPDVAARAGALAEEIAGALGHVGVIAVEMFLLEDGTLLVNEIAPRVHNSGHHTLESCDVSQFEQHVRAVCGLPMAHPSQSAPAVMVNLMGELWRNGEPRWSVLDGVPGLTLHIYGKTEARAGRKMGHYVVVGPGAEAELARADERLASLAGRP